MKNIAIITARGGSKRIPRKNIKDFCGKPVMAYSIEAALKSNLFDEVMVSTEDEEIAEIAKKYGAAVPFYRSEKTSNDFASTKDVLIEVIERYKEDGIYFDNMCCIYPVAPFITPKRLNETYDEFLKTDKSSLLPVVEFSVPPQTGYYIRNESLIPFTTDKLPSRTQDMEKVYYDPGQFYWHRIEMYLSETGPMNAAPFIISQMEAQDVDNNEDWDLAELKYKLLKNREK